MAEQKTYTGGCHCGAVRYTVRLALEGVVTCNCSICSTTGTAMAFAPASDFELSSGADVLTDYQFGREHIHHLFCSRCGIRSFCRGAMPDGTPTVAINVRCLHGVDLASLPERKFDGRSRPLD